MRYEVICLIQNHLKYEEPQKARRAFTDRDIEDLRLHVQRPSRGISHVVKEERILGIFINEDIIPGRIKKKDWESVYTESLKLVEDFPFLDKVVKETDLGNRYVCAEHTKERNDIFRSYTGWRSLGDMLTGDNTEDFEMYRCLDDYNVTGEDNGADILTMEILNDKYSGIKVIDREAVSMVFGGKTQGELSHRYLLGIACLISDRFPEAAYVSGDISVGQCRAAVKWANGLLDKPIGLPVQCDARRLLKRIMAFEGADGLGGKILDIFFKLSLENRDKGTGDAIRELVPQECIRDYFLSHFLKEKEFLSSEVRKYLGLGFSLEGLIKLLVTDPDGYGLPPNEFFDILFGMQVQVGDKETYDVTEGDRNSESSDDVSMQFTRMFGIMGGAYNKNVDCYIPLDEIREVCKKEMGTLCEVDTEIRDALDRDKAKRRDKESASNQIQQQLYDDDNSEFRQKVEQARKKNEENKKYDIRRMENIVCYKPGDTFEPELEDVLTAMSGQIHAFDIKSRFDEFVKLDQSGREKELIEMDDTVLMPDRTWDRILENIMDDEYILRYYSILSVDVTYQRQYEFIHRTLMNPDFLDYFWEKAPDKE